VDLTLGAGEYCGLIGPNGAGKTTLFDVVSGHGRPTSGRIELLGTDVTARSAVWRARHGLRRTFQRQQVFGALTVEHNVLAAEDWRGGEGGFVADVLGLPLGRSLRQEREARVDHVLELCGLTEVRDEYAGNLPIGAARMVELARAVVDEPQVLLLDEPTSGLSHEQTQRLAEVVDAVRQETGCAVLLVEHDVPFVMAHCQRVVCLNLGEVLAVGTPAEIQADAAVREAYLG
jgi:branched-chain amino acid transport system ATP-binding protein